MHKYRFVIIGAGVVAIALLFLFGGSALTVMAAQNALPGDRLYPVKTSLEQTRTSLSRDAGDRAELYIDFAGKRLQEIEQLIVEGRYRNITPTMLEFEIHVQNALLEIEALSARHPERAARLLQQTNLVLLDYASALSLMALDVPDPVRAEMLRAQQMARRASGEQNQNANLNENLNRSTNENADNENQNRNANRNEDANFNQNNNQNEDRNRNTNRNQNTNENRNQNDNKNEDRYGNENESRKPAPTATRTKAPAPTATAAPTKPAPPKNDNERPPAPSGCSYGAVSVDNLNVPENTTCTLEGTRVKGNITVRSGATLIASGVSVDGNIQANGASRVDVSGNSYVGGSIQVDNSGSLSVNGVRINGNLQSKQNWGRQSFSSNRIGGDLQAFDNSGGVSSRATTSTATCSARATPRRPLGAAIPSAEIKKTSAPGFD
jgi:hypothetical protein